VEKPDWTIKTMKVPNPSDNLMFFKIALDCSKDDPEEFKKHSAAALAASKLCNDYSKMKQVFLGIEPESYAESWMVQNLVRATREFEDLVVIYFVKIVLKVKSSRKSRKPRK